jgi:gluconate 5-dehydrogenase
MTGVDANAISGAPVRAAGPAAPHVDGDPFSVAGQIALVTGSCQGLGYEIAHGLAVRGATVIVHGRDAAKARQVSLSLQSSGLSVDWLAFDIGDEDGRKRAFASIAQRYGRLHVLVNNASIRARKTLTDLSTSEIAEIVNTNLLATIEVTRQAAALMREIRYGRIVTITSISGRLVRYGDFIYPISKQALDAMTRSAAVEYGRDGIVCNAIAPGTFATEFNRELISKPENIAKMQERNPLKRWGEPHEIVAPAVFLASKGASYINGHTVVVDGGFSIGF